ncbi:hypothetical protein ALP98_200089 [Pseudomonas viridiflava]|uniref:Uncharacterized protein n=1 Tax=Pseudomonas viridiflava TaxID=33069 RepID=A0A3M4J3A7_PSEVI|nr:hypothetical protein ALQ09_200095 [Pseudomonas viridiflava]RMQ70669.1 hypothetical protein ALP98_200089 [Pseudomonas viridiflava]
MLKQIHRSANNKVSPARFLMTFQFTKNKLEGFIRVDIYIRNVWLHGTILWLIRAYVKKVS